MKEEGLLAIARFVLGVAFTLGLPLAWALLLNWRDRRAARALAAVRKVLQPFARELRGHLVVWVRCGAFSRRSVVRISAMACSVADAGAMVTRLAESFGSRVRLEVRGPFTEQVPFMIVIETTGRFVRAQRPDPVSPGMSECAWSKRP